MPGITAQKSSSPIVPANETGIVRLPRTRSNTRRQLAMAAFEQPQPTPPQRGIQTGLASRPVISGLGNILVYQNQTDMWHFLNVDKVTGLPDFVRADREMSEKERSQEFAITHKDHGTMKVAIFARVEQGMDEAVACKYAHDVLVYYDDTVKAGIFPDTWEAYETTVGYFPDVMLQNFTFSDMTPRRAIDWGQEEAKELTDPENVKLLEGRGFKDPWWGTTEGATTCAGGNKKASGTEKTGGAKQSGSGGGAAPTKKQGLRIQAVPATAEAQGSGSDSDDDKKEKKKKGTPHKKGGRKRKGKKSEDDDSSDEKSKKKKTPKKTPKKKAKKKEKSPSPSKSSSDSYSTVSSLTQSEVEARDRLVELQEIKQKLEKLGQSTTKTQPERQPSLERQPSQVTLAPTSSQSQYEVSTQPGDTDDYFDILRSNLTDAKKRKVRETDKCCTNCECYHYTEESLPKELKSTKSPCCYTHRVMLLQQLHFRSMTKRLTEIERKDDETNRRLVRVEEDLESVKQYSKTTAEDKMANVERQKDIETLGIPWDRYCDASEALRNNYMTIKKAMNYVPCLSSTGRNWVRDSMNFFMKKSLWHRMYPSGTKCHKNKQSSGRLFLWGTEYFIFPEGLMDAMMDFVCTKFRHIDNVGFKKTFNMTLENGRKMHAINMRNMFYDICTNPPFHPLYLAVWWEGQEQLGVFDRPAPLWQDHNDDEDRDAYYRLFEERWEETAATLKEDWTKKKPKFTREPAGTKGKRSKLAEYCPMEPKWAYMAD